MEGKLVLTTLAFAVIVGLMYWGAAIARRKLGIGAGTVLPGELKVVGKRTLEPNKALYVVKVADRYILVGAAEGSLNLVDRITPDEFALMTDPQDEAAAAPADEAPAAAADEVEATPDSPVPADRFMSVSESFTYFLGKAKRSRGAATGRVPAQASAATTDDPTDSSTDE